VNTYVISLVQDKAEFFNSDNLCGNTIFYEEISLKTPPAYKLAVPSNTKGVSPPSSNVIDVTPLFPIKPLLISAIVFGIKILVNDEQSPKVLLGSFVSPDKSTVVNELHY
jgi:hypothetical protein